MIDSTDEGMQNVQLKLPDSPFSVTDFAGVFDSSRMPQIPETYLNQESFGQGMRRFIQDSAAAMIDGYEQERRAGRQNSSAAIDWSAVEDDIATRLYINPAIEAVMAEIETATK